MRTKWMPLLLMAALLTGCKFQCSVGNNGTDTKEVSSTNEPGPTGGARIENDIELDAQNVRVTQAYLTDENRNVLESNAVGLNENIYCTVRLDTGWTKYGDKSFVGASEKIMTEDGNVILDVPDLFKEYTESGVSAEDAKVLSVSAVITKKQPGVDNYKVQFRMWDKKGDGEVKGSFKFKVK
jgi:hypothetical protein